MNPARTVPSGMVFALKIAFSGALLWLLFSRVDIARFWAVASQSSPAWLAIALLAYVVAVLVSSWRWHRLLRIQSVTMTYPAVTESFIVALFFNNFLPTNIGGDVMRIRDTAGPAGSSARATTVVVADRIIGLIGLVLVAAVGGASTAMRLPFSVWWVWVGLMGGIGASISVLLIPSLLDGMVERLAFLQESWVGAQLAALASSLANFRAAPLELAGALIGSVFVQAANIAFYTAVSRALDVRVGVIDMALIVPLTALIQVIPVSVNGFGVREAAFTVFFGRIGIPAESALLVSLEATALILGFSLVGAAMYVIRHRLPTPPVAATAVGVPPPSA